MQRWRATPSDNHMVGLLMLTGTISQCSWFCNAIIMQWGFVFLFFIWLGSAGGLINLKTATCCSSSTTCHHSKWPHWEESIHSTIMNCLSDFWFIVKLGSRPRTSIQCREDILILCVGENGDGAVWMELSQKIRLYDINCLMRKHISCSFQFILMNTLTHIHTQSHFG